MFELIENYFQHKDDRGSLSGLVNFGVWKEINLISSVAGTTRGNHYHKETEELFIFLEGKVEITFEKVENGKLSGQKETRIFTPHEVFLIQPLVFHTFKVLEDSRWINLLSLPIKPGAEDIHRLT